MESNDRWMMHSCFISLAVGAIAAVVMSIILLK